MPFEQRLPDIRVNRQSGHHILDRTAKQHMSQREHARDERGIGEPGVIGPQPARGQLHESRARATQLRQGIRAQRVEMTIGEQEQLGSARDLPRAHDHDRIAQ